MLMNFSLMDKKLRMLSLNIKNTFLVVVYNKSIIESRTLNYFMASKVNFNLCRLIIWNNGPLHINEEEFRFKTTFSDVKFIQTIDNLPLSYVYNVVIGMYNSNYYTILDDDSDINDNYISKVLMSISDVSVPMIFSNGIIRSPSINKKFKLGPYNKNDNLIAIGSGLTFSKEISDIMKNNYGDVFDSNYAFYGVDSSFFWRLKKLHLIDRVLTIDGFEHSLSRLEKESEIVSEFRNRERIYDAALTSRYYFGISKRISVFLKQIIKILFRVDGYKDFKLYFVTFYRGYHPKVNQYRNK